MTMYKKKYIDIYKNREDFYNNVLSILSDDTTNDRANEIIDVFDSLPAADVQEVMRCKDCKFLCRDFSKREIHLCMRSFILQEVALEDYCSWGKERVDSEEQQTESKVKE